MALTPGLDRLGLFPLQQMNSWDDLMEVYIIIGGMYRVDSGLSLS